MLIEYLLDPNAQAFIPKVVNGGWHIDTSSPVNLKYTTDNKLVLPEKIKVGEITLGNSLPGNQLSAMNSFQNGGLFTTTAAPNLNPFMQGTTVTMRTSSTTPQQTPRNLLTPIMEQFAKPKQNPFPTVPIISQNSQMINEALLNHINSQNAQTDGTAASPPNNQFGFQQINEQERSKILQPVLLRPNFVMPQPNKLQSEQYFQQNHQGQIINGLGPILPPSGLVSKQPTGLLDQQGFHQNYDNPMVVADTRTEQKSYLNQRNNSKGNRSKEFFFYLILFIFVKKIFIKKNHSDEEFEIELNLQLFSAKFRSMFDILTFSQCSGCNSVTHHSSR